MSKLIPDSIMQHFQTNLNIGRYDLARVANISNQEARYYCRLYRDLHKKAKLIGKGIATFDWHYPLHDRACLNIVVKAIEMIRPDHFVFGGDQLNLDCISHHNKGKIKLLENRRISKDFVGFQEEIMDRIEKVLPRGCKKYFMIGNHEYWIDRLIEDNPQLEGLMEVENNLDLSKYEIVPFNNILRIGEMTFIHGIYVNKYHAEKHLRIYQKMLFYGHLHTNQVYTSIAPTTSLPKQAVGVGCLCNRNAEYMRNRPNDWLHQFLIWYMFSDGTFVYQTPIIINGKTVVNGKIIDGNKCD
jgi:predicted phosphohydrolase